ncbi:MAG: hypothetical protein AB7J28_08205 [Hyphomonadaceae bacterium]
MTRFDFSSVLIEAEPSAGELAEALAFAFNCTLQEVTIFRYDTVRAAADPDGHGVEIVYGRGMMGASPGVSVEAQIVGHQLGDAPLHLDIDYDAHEALALDEISARLARYLTAHVTYDAGNSDPFDYWRVDCDGLLERVSVFPVDQFQDVIDDRDGYYIFPNAELRD